MESDFAGEKIIIKNVKIREQSKKIKTLNYIVNFLKVSLKLPHENWTFQYWWKIRNRKKHWYWQIFLICSHRKVRRFKFFYTKKVDVIYYAKLRDPIINLKIEDRLIQLSLCRKGFGNPVSFEKLSREHFSVNMIQNFNNVNLSSSAINIYESSLQITSS